MGLSRLINVVYVRDRTRSFYGRPLIKWGLSRPLASWLLLGPFAFWHTLVWSTLISAFRPEAHLRAAQRLSELAPLSGSPVAHFSRTF